MKALPGAPSTALMPEPVTDKDEQHLKAIEPAQLPCNVFGTIDRCDGMACEHDGHCYSGCCALFVSGAQKRCMPLVNGDLCPIAIDVVDTFQVMDEGYGGELGFESAYNPD